MSLLDELVNNALNNQSQLSSLRVVVEKELLHHDILRTLSENDLLNSLTFIGGTCLRACYGGIRLSEDLDFTGGKDFSRADLTNMGEILTNALQNKYNLKVKVDVPKKDIKNVDTWKIKVETRPEQKHLPAQRINIDICRIPSYERRPMLLLNPYGVDMGTSGLIIQAESREEIYTDKLLAFALRPNRIKYRDLWDMVWLHQKALKPNFSLLPAKLNDRQLTKRVFLEAFNARKDSLSDDKSHAVEFIKEMQRFLPAEQVKKTITQAGYFEFLIFLIDDLAKQCTATLSA